MALPASGAPSLEELPAPWQREILQTLFDMLPDPIVVVNSEGVILASNRAWNSAQDADADGTLLSAGDPAHYLQRWEHAVEEGREQAPAVLELLRNILRGDRASGSALFRWGLAAGLPRWFQLTAQTLPHRGGALIIHQDISREKHSESEVLRVSERERRLISQDLHDGLCQHLGGVALLAKSLANSLAQAQRSEAELARQLSELVYQAVSQTRTVARALHPVRFDSDGLAAALHDLALQTHDLVPCEFHLANHPLVADHAIAGSLYRIAQEAVKNAVQHGNPSRIRMELKRTQHQLVLTVEDDGSGLPPGGAACATGLALMHYHARSVGATLELARPRAGGTRVRCRVPLSIGGRLRTLPPGADS